MICFAGMTDFVLERQAHERAVALENTKAPEPVVAQEMVTVFPEALAVEEALGAGFRLVDAYSGMGVVCKIEEEVAAVIPSSDVSVAEDGMVTTSLQSMAVFTDVMASLRNSVNGTAPTARNEIAMVLNANDPNPHRSVETMISSIGSLDLSAPDEPVQTEPSKTPYFDACYQKCVTAFAMGQKPFWEPLIGAAGDGLKAEINGHTIIVFERNGQFYVEGPQALVTTALIPSPGVAISDNQLSGLFGPEANQSLLHLSVASILNAFSPAIATQPTPDPVSMSRELRPYLLQRFDKLWEMSPSNTGDTTVPIRDSRQGGRGLYLEVSFGGLQVFEVPNSQFLHFEAPEGLVMSGWLKETSGIVTNDLFDLFFGDETGQKKNLAIAVRDRLADAERRFTRQH